MIFVPAFRTYYFFPLICPFYCNLTQYFDRSWKRPFRCRRFSNWVDRDDRSSSRNWFLVSVAVWEEHSSTSRKENFPDPSLTAGQQHPSAIWDLTTGHSTEAVTFLLIFKWQQKTRVVLRRVLWTCPRSKILAVYWSKQVILIPEMVQNILRLLRKDCQIYCWTATNAALPGHSKQYQTPSTAYVVFQTFMFVCTVHFCNIVGKMPAKY